MSNDQADAAGAAGTGNDGAKEGFDARLRRLEEIVQGLEEGDLDLEPAIERYREGIHLLKGCRDILGTYKRQVEELTQEAESALQPYSGDPDAAGGPGA